MPKQKNHKPKPPKEKYQNRKKYFDKMAQYFSKRANQISNLRLLIALLGIGGAAYFFVINSPLVGMAILLASLVVFVILVIKHRSFSEKKDYARVLMDINNEALQRLKGDWNSFNDTGEEFVEEEHPYARDLNIIGQGSFFQWINTTTTFSGRNKLHQMLTTPCQETKTIKKRQEAILELSKKLEWQQNLMAEGRIIDSSSKLTDPESLFSWAKKENKFYLNPLVITATKLLPFVTTLLIILAFFTGMSYIFPAPFVILQILILIPGYTNRIQDFNLTTRYNDKLTAYKKMLILLEEEEFEAPLLKELQYSLLETKASKELARLERIVEAISQRYFQLYIIFNVLFLLDYRWQISLEKWRKESGEKLEVWFDVLGEIEALASLSNISRDNPHWTFPEIVNEEKFLEAKDLSHPLLTGHRVCNDVEIIPPVSTLLITGSNMSGKSTLLRTIGLNLVMAYIGTPVCTNYFRASLMKVYSCMQVSDNLEKNISTFYAELLRIQNIVKTAENEPVFFLLDEIFKGTNSTDRHTGAKTVIKKLINEGAIGLVSTHDLELGDLEKEEAGVKNYHFREYYENGKIKFDYILRPGLSPTTNAIYLMKLAGIEPEVEASSNRSKSGRSSSNTE